jgi:hypothetical protein
MISLWQFMLQMVLLTAGLWDLFLGLWAMVLVLLALLLRLEREVLLLLGVTY